MAEGKKIIGFRRVRGRVVPISGQIAGNAGVSAIAVGATGIYLEKSARKSLSQVKKDHRLYVKRAKDIKKYSQSIQHDKLIKDMTNGDFLLNRNSILKMTEANTKNKTANRNFGKFVMREIRGAKMWKRAALGLGAISLGAMAYQKMAKK